MLSGLGYLILFSIKKIYLESTNVDFIGEYAI
jgi:hypothetical protein